MLNLTRRMALLSAIGTVGAACLPAKIASQLFDGPIYDLHGPGGFLVLSVYTRFGRIRQVMHADQKLIPATGKDGWQVFRLDGPISISTRMRIVGGQIDIDWIWVHIEPKDGENPLWLVGQKVC